MATRTPIAEKDARRATGNADEALKAYESGLELARNESVTKLCRDIKHMEERAGPSTGIDRVGNIHQGQGHSQLKNKKANGQLGSVI